MTTDNAIASANICFMANFYKTIFFHELSKKLSSNGVSIFWIITKLDQYDFLKKYFPLENLLYISRSYIKHRDEQVDDFRINELVYGDRVLKYEVEDGLNFLSNIQKPIYNFLLQNKIQFVFGEITWAHELLVHRMVNKRNELKCKYLECSLVRIPNNRFAFFTDETQNEMLEFNEVIDKGKIIAIEKPSYLKINDKIVSNNRSVFGRLNRLKRFVTGENIKKNDPNVITNSWRRLKVAAQEEINKTAYKYIKNKVSVDYLSDKKFIFVGFHKQPEASIDVSGRYYEDQFLNVVNLWRMLPKDWKLIVKEHTNAIGDRSYSFYKRLQNFPGILIADETTDSKLLIQKSTLVVSVTGTIAYEAALLKKPSITFSKVFFNRINYCKFVTLDELVRYQSLEVLVDEISSQVDNRVEFSDYLMSNTFTGYITDPNTDPSVLEEENLKNVGAAFLKLIHRHG